MSAPHSPPGRTGTVMTKSSRDSEDDAIPAEDTSEVTKLFQERLRAWKHAVSYLDDYITANEKLQQSHGKEYEKLLKNISRPLQEGHHFDEGLGGIAGFFDVLRSNTQGISNSHYEAQKALKGSVIPIFERLHQEIKNKTKELIKGAGKGSKAVEKARQATQKYIELLGQHAATFDSTGGKVGPNDDPYVLNRGVRHRLNRQIMEENANRQDLLAVQNNFASFEAHIISTIQNGMGQFHSVLSKQSDATKTFHGDTVGVAQRIPRDFEWGGFMRRNAGVLIDPDAPPREMANVTFPNQTHRATVPLIAGSLERRGKVLRRWDTVYCVVTPSKFLHEFKTDDDFAREPLPEISLFLPDCVVGAVDGAKFVVKGKDSSRGKLGVSVGHMTHDYTYKAHTAADALKWWEIVRKAAGQIPGGEKAEVVAPVAVGGRDSESPASPATPASATASSTAPGSPATADTDRFAADTQRFGTVVLPAQSTGTTAAASSSPTAFAAAATAFAAAAATTTDAGQTTGTTSAPEPPKLKQPPPPQSQQQAPVHPSAADEKHALALAAEREAAHQRAVEAAMARAEGPHPARAVTFSPVGGSPTVTSAEPEKPPIKSMTG